MEKKLLREYNNAIERAKKQKEALEIDKKIYSKKIKKLEEVREKMIKAYHNCEIASKNLKKNYNSIKGKEDKLYTLIDNVSSSVESLYKDQRVGWKSINPMIDTTSMARKAINFAIEILTEEIKELTEEKKYYLMQKN